MGGPVYRYDDQLQSDTKWPAYFDGSEVFYEWSRSYLKDVKFDDDGEPAADQPDVRPAAASASRSRWTWSSGLTARST